MPSQTLAHQLPLFTGSGRSDNRPISAGDGVLTPQTRLVSAAAEFHGHMVRQGFSANTIKAFGGDLAIFLRFVGETRTLEEISTQQLNDFLLYLREYRGIPCNAKSYQRRLTTLKVFFHFLHQQRAIPRDPAATIAHQPVSSPLPDVLFPGQVERLTAAARHLETTAKRDSRPNLILTLILATGIKKSECMNIRLADIDLSNVPQPMLYVRYQDPRRRHKERKLKLPSELLGILECYCEQYQVQDQLFECTPRNLEYVLADLAREAGLSVTVSFETLRWTCAVRDFQKGMREETLRQKLGLSSITWPEVLDKIRKLAAAPL